MVGNGVIELLPSIDEFGGGTTSAFALKRINKALSGKEIIKCRPLWLHFRGRTICGMSVGVYCGYRLGLFMIGRIRSIAITK